MNNATTTVVCRDAALAAELVENRRRSGADRWDYQLGDVYIMSPSPTAGHQELVDVIQERLRPAARAEGLRSNTALNVGVTRNEKGWYVIPDIVVVDQGVGDVKAVADVRLAIEVRSGEKEQDKLAEYRQVKSNVSALTVDEVWYVTVSDVAVYRSPLIDTTARRVKPDDSSVALAEATARPDWLRIVLDAVAH